FVVKPIVGNQGRSELKQISFLLCFRYLQHRRIVILSMAAVMLSCALLIVTDSLFTGFINAVENSVGQYLGDVVFEAPPGKTLTEYDAFIDRLNQAESIESATAVLSSQGLLLSSPGKVKAARVWGIEPSRTLAVTPLNEAMLFQKDNDRPDIRFTVPDNPDAAGGIAAIGLLTQPDELTDEYDIEGVKGMLGRPMALTTGTVIQDPQNTETSQVRFSRRVIKFSLADVVRTGINEFDESLVLLPIGALSAQLHPDEATCANMLHIRLVPGADAEAATLVIRGIWRDFAADRFNWSDFVTIISTKRMQAQLIGEYKKQMKVLLFIFGLVSAGIILLVFCIFYLIVMTRRKDIGILKSCGLSSPSVAGMFVLFGVVVGIVGAVAGIGLGWLIIDNINAIEQAIASVFGLKLWKASTYMFTQIPNTMHWGSVLWVTGAGITAAAIGSLIPAAAAARVKPVETLQYE
ncbi:MAG: ABC transporter permease, partial [Planctomycetota bacterium]